MSPKTTWTEDEMSATLEALRIDPTAFEAALKTVHETTGAIRPFLAGLEPIVQSLTMAELLVVYLMGFQNPEQRRAVLTRHEELVRLLIKDNEEHEAEMKEAAERFQYGVAHG